MIRLDLGRVVPSQNATMWRHWRAYQQERDVWYYLIRAQLVPRLPIKRKVYGVILSYRSKQLDYGNLVGGAKPIPDALVKLGYLKDDNPTWCEFVYAQEIDGRELTVVCLSTDRPLTVADAKTTPPQPTIPGRLQTTGTPA